MSELVDDLTIAMPVVILPVRRRLGDVLKAITVLLLVVFIVALLSSKIIEFFQGGITEEAVPAKEEKMGGIASIVNLAYFLSIIIIVSLIIVVLMKYGKFGIIKAFMVSVVALLILTFTYMMSILFQVYIIILLCSVGFESIAIMAPLIIPISLALTGVFLVGYILSIVKLKHINMRNMVLVLNTVWAAVWMGWNCGMLTPIILLIGFAIYDAYSVFRGPLREIVEVLRGDGEADEDAGIILGLGDIFFYSFATAYSYAVLGFLRTIAVVVALYVGVIITLFLLLRYEAKALPVLPIPLLLAVTLIAIFYYM